jgi:hypothetical protein
MFDSGWILANQQWAEVVENPYHGQLTPGQASLANTRDTVIGIDNDKQKITPPIPHRIDLNASDFYRYSSVCLR